MKRFGYLYEKVCDMRNLQVADSKARLHKSGNWGIKKHDRHPMLDLEKLLLALLNLSYETSLYSTFKVYEPKERLIYRLPYFPDRICPHTYINLKKYKVEIILTYK